MPYSSNDMLATVAELNCRRIGKVYGKQIKMQGGKWIAPDNEMKLLKLARVLHHRYEEGEYHHTEVELGQIIELMNLLVIRDAKNKGNIPRIVDINLGAMVTTNRLSDPRKGGRVLKGYHYEQLTYAVLGNMGHSQGS